MNQSIKNIVQEYENNNIYTQDIQKHGKKQRELPLIKKLDDKLKELGYNMEDKFFHQFAELNGEVVKVSWNRTDYRLMRVNIEYDRLVCTEIELEQ